MLTDNVPFLYLSGIGHPKYFIPEGVTIMVGDYGQYLIHERGQMEMVGHLDLRVGAELIVLEK